MVTQGVVFINLRHPGFTSTCKDASSSFTSIDICEVKVMGCDDSRYGVGCGRECLNKCKNRHCDAFNCSCIHGCTDPNALTSDCIVCSDRTYISSGMCVRCPGRCKNDSLCNKLTGRCDQVCDKNWTGQFCEKEECGKCKDVAGCNWTSGLCPNGCKEHWVSPLCKECEPYKYGPNCAFDCGHCKDNKQCSMDTGDCPSGCMEGWIGKHCITVTPSADKQGTGKPSFFTLAVVLLVLFTVLIGFVVFLIFIRSNTRPHNIMTRVHLRILKQRTRKRIQNAKKIKRTRKYYQLFRF
uniref:Uncharacterized protein n=1 Tax=Magallana gigas TaxID=29159 RepID=A0A8W8JL73_MAGGI